jgi:AbrB family looped-hinge helix DNA binding protein
MMRITSKGQVTIPADIREQAGLLPHTEVDFEFEASRCELSGPMPVANPVEARGWSHTCADAAISPLAPMPSWL